MDLLFKNLVWPAIAGNVAWSFFSVAIGEQLSCSVVARLTTLLLIAIYLMAAWVRDREAQSKLAYFTLDGIFAIAIATAAIATGAAGTATSWTASGAVIAIFGVSALGHVFKVWDPQRPSRQRNLLAAANGIGILIVAITAKTAPTFVLWSHVGGIAAVLVVLACLWNYVPVKNGGG